VDENGKVGNFLLPLTEGNEKLCCLNVAEVEIKRGWERHNGMAEGSKKEKIEEEEEETEKGWTHYLKKKV